jgi:hypothetical protein
VAAGALVLAGLGHALAPAAFARQAPSPPPAARCTAADLPGLAVQYARASRALGSSVDRTPGSPDSTDARRWALVDHLLRVVGVVAGEPAPPAHDGVGAGGVPVGLPSPPTLPCGQAVRARDRAVWSLTVLGYDAREIADVVAGRLSQRDLDAAHAMLMTGQPRQHVAEFIEARWRPARAAPVGLRVRRPSGEAGSQAPRLLLSPRRAMAIDSALSLEAHAERLAAQHGVDASLVHAVIQAESGWRPNAVSAAGAIGLMQLMPMTAAALGVNPWNPIENLRGGIAYLAGLLDAYGDPTLALIAYNAGNQHADRVRAGLSVPYRETRRFLETIRARHPLPAGTR